jgi:diguanylate cyclase (GGDEF)-like protein
MDNINLREIVISADSHSIISADSGSYGIVKSDTLDSFENYVTKEYREDFLNNIALAKDSWFPTKMITDHGEEMFYVRASKTAGTGMIKLMVANIEELMEAHYKLVHQVSANNAQLNLYEDVFFEYDPSSGLVEVSNTDITDFDSGTYSLYEFETLLCKRAGSRQIHIIKGFIGQIESKVGRFSVRIDANILNDDTSVTYTSLEGAFVFFDKERDGVVGHIHLGRTKGRAYAASIKHDSLTGLVDKTDIIRIAKERVDERRLEGTTFAIIDIDFFKNINDTYGHQYGDEVIKKIADIISSEVGNDGISGRYGGDEFLVVFYNITSEDELRIKLKNIKNMVSATFADKGPDESIPLSVSIGAATFPKDADNYDDLFMLADYCLYIAKDKGRNRYVIYTFIKHGTLESIRLKRLGARKINGRDLSGGEVIVKMFDMTLHSNGSTPEHFMDEFIETFELQHVSLFVGEPYKHRYSTGLNVIRDKNAIDFALGVLNSDAKNRFLGDRDFVVVNRIDALPPQANSVKEFLRELGVFSYVLLRFHDRDGRECILMIASVGKLTQWNQMHYKFYRALTDLLSLYSLGV